MHRSITLAFAAFAVLFGNLLSTHGVASEPARVDGILAERFERPVDADKPWAYWWWINGNVDKATITRDLEQMKDKGFAGLLLFDARGYHDDHVPPPPSRMDFMSPEWREMLQFAVSEASRLGIEMSINLSSCAGALKGPWEVGDDSPKRLIWTSMPVAGPKKLQLELKTPDEPNFRDVALFAVKSVDVAPLSEDLADGWRTIVRNHESETAAEEVVDLASHVDRQGRLTWSVPDGKWTILRFARSTMEGHEYDVDVLDPQAVAGHFQRLGAQILEDAGPAAGKTVTHFYSVSWEGAAPTWTRQFARQFRAYRGYDPRPYLPVLAGVTVTSRTVSDRFLRDYYKTLGDLFRDNFYGKLRALCNERGLQWHSESGGPWNRKLSAFQIADQLAFLARNDMPQGEFWHLGRPMNRQPAMAAHVYGKRLAATEAFTHMRAHWSAYPATLKRDADGAFIDGVNHFIWHTFSCSPPEFGKPGIEYFAGTHVNPNVTWFPQAGGLLAYLARCQTMLRQGLFVADVCCYTGDKPYMHWGRGEKWSKDASMVLGKGYTYDIVTDEVLLDRMSCKDGRLVLPDGMSYKVLVLDLEDESVSPKVLEKILDLARAGATVVLGPRRPAQALGLQDYPACDGRVQRLAKTLWDGGDFGHGQVISGKPIDEVLADERVLPDFEGPWEYTHRRDGGTDIYFVSGSGYAECVFRIAGREPELWDPKTGAIRDAVCYRTTDDGRTVVPIALPEGGSTFVVFRRPAATEHLVSVSGLDEGLEVVGRSDSDVRVKLWGNGRHSLQPSAASPVSIESSDLPEAREIAGPWSVRFAPGWGAPESVTLEQLVPWNEHADEGVKYFSGEATYKKTLTLTKDEVAGLVRLQLGQVGHVAEVRLNGKPLGVVWSAPWSVELTGIAKEGDNELEIDVVNLWPNRLIGDSRLPKEQRFTKSSVRLFKADDKYRVFQGFSPKDPLLPSGLIGPVRVEFGEAREAKCF